MSGFITGTKKDKIRELLNRGGYTDIEIARMIGTTLANVRKEKSLYSKEGGKKVTLSREQREVETSPTGATLSKTEKMSIELERDLLSVPPLDEQQLKLMYSDFTEGKTPGVIIKMRGFHPQVVEIEYARFIRTDRLVPPQIANKIFTFAFQSDEIKKFREKFDTTGVLTFEGLDTLLNVMMAATMKQGFEKFLCGYLDEPRMPLPNCCSRPICAVCKEPVDGIIYSNQEWIKNQFTSPFCYCSKCAKTVFSRR